MILHIIDNNYNRHEIWEDLKSKYSESIFLDYDDNLSPTSIDLLDCNILLLRLVI